MVKVMLTGQADLQAVTRVVNEANLYRYIAKPWDAADLVLTVREALDKFRSQRELEERHAQLERLTVHLEDEVRARTRDLHAALGRNQAILDNMVDGLVAIDNERRIQLQNPAFAAMFEGAAPVGAPVEALPGELARIAEQCLRGEPTERLPVDLDGGREGCAVTSPIRSTDEDAAHIGCLLLIRDVTVEREMSRMKDEFVRIVSHDLKNPIGVIRGYAELLREEGHADDPDASDLISQIEKGADRMLALVTDLLDLARVEDGRAYSPVHVELTPFLRDVVSEFELPAAQKQLQLSLQRVPESLRVNMDPTRMRQVLTNLLSNAIKYSREHGKVEVGVDVTSRFVELRVSDEGLGIPEDSLPHLFEKFYRVPGSKHRGPEGTGLGLAIVKAIVEQHSGHIHVESQLDAGTTFRVRVPADLD